VCRGWQAIGALHDHEAPARGGAVLHARGHLLADIAALFEAHAIELFQSGIECGKRNQAAIGAVGHAEASSDVPYNRLAKAAERAREYIARGNDAQPQRRKARVGDTNRARRHLRRRAILFPARPDGELRLRRDFDLGAELILDSAC
jgi:hypothetical protein